MGNQKEDIMLEIYNLLQTTTGKSLFETIDEKQKALEISNLQLANILSIPKSTFDRIIKNIEDNNLHDVDFYLVLKLGQFLGVGIEEMSQIYVASLKPEKIKELESARKANYILSTFDLKSLKKIGFIENISDFESIEERIKSFFCLNTIFEYSNEVGGVLFSRTKNLSNDKMRELWVRSAMFQFQKRENPNDFEVEKLLAIIPKIRPYTRYEEKGFLSVLQALYNVGVTVIVQTYLSKTQVRGGTFAINNKPCIVITDFNKNYPTLWFALLHELYHVIYDFTELKKLTYHLTGEEQSELYLFREDLADYFAREMLFPKENLAYIKHLIKMPTMVNDYAEKLKVHPSIIYSFYCYEENEKGKNYYASFNHYFGKSDKAIQVVRTHPWDKETIYHEIDKANKILVPNNS
ncbi:MAG: hypothetical protein ABJA78_02240 [Ferruginibacter sp.]